MANETMSTTFRCGHEVALPRYAQQSEYERRLFVEKMARIDCTACRVAASARPAVTRDQNILITPSSQSAEGMVIAALERGVDVAARLAAWNEDELSEEDDW